MPMMKSPRKSKQMSQRILVFLKVHGRKAVGTASITSKLGRRNGFSIYQVNNVPDGLTVEEALEKVVEMPLPKDNFQFDWPEEES